MFKLFFNNSIEESSAQALKVLRGELVEVIKQIQFLESVKFKDDNESIPF